MSTVRTGGSWTGATANLPVFGETTSGRSVHFTIATHSAVPINTTNSTDGSDGPVMGTRGTVLPITPLTVASLGCTDVVVSLTVSPGVRSVPPCHNPNFVSTPPGDLGLSSSGPVPGLTLSSNASCIVVSILSTTLSTAVGAFTTDMPSVTACCRCVYTSTG